MSVYQFCTFYINEHLFGIDILAVREISRQLEMTPLHKVPSYVRGILNLRGQIITVLDISNRLGFNTRQIGGSTRSIILKSDMELENVRGKRYEEEYSLPDTIGLLVDRIGEVLLIDEKDIALPPANIDSIYGKYISGVYKSEMELLSILKVKQICS